MKNAISDENSINTPNIFDVKRYISHSYLPIYQSKEFRQNKILNSLEDENLLISPLELIELSVGQRLFEFGSYVPYVYFPTSAIVSLLYVLENGSSTEISVAGSEGMVGISALMDKTALGDAVVQSAGRAFRIKPRAARQMYDRGGDFQKSTMLYIHSLLSQMTQNCVCGRHYTIEQQLSRWLLERFDRSSIKEIKITQEVIANNLGVRRESVTEASRKLQDAGLVRCTRGCITILNRKDLELRAGECYEMARL
ncbi:Crp/Fnr family transcriptional regulator [Undibacterium sp. RuTC16W]|uniref:Crp/Fnr family transcriptional regulator n=1 Tax=Undibacterium sp. RuTC16W TaxID=3413048 RepID=UPI003BF0EECF